MKLPKKVTMICNKNVYLDGNKQMRVFTNGRKYSFVNNQSQVSTIDDQGVVHVISKGFFDQHFSMPVRKTYGK